MKIHTKRLQISLAIMALIIILFSVIFSNIVMSRLANEERQKMEVWSEATRLLLSDNYSEFVFRIIENNENIPVIIADAHDRFISSRNFPEIPEAKQERYYQKKIKQLKKRHVPIEIVILGGENQYIYYDDSILLKQLSFFPYVQLGIILIFLILAYWAFSAEYKMEQNKVWVGLTKETAHQLGTPITSLLAWEALLKASYPDDMTVSEMGKDVQRLGIIAERFSKVGSVPHLETCNIVEVVKGAMNYMEGRTSCKIFFNIHSEEEEIMADINAPLFTWVIENLCKNAVDSMDGEGKIEVEMLQVDQQVIIDFSDTGKGIERSRFRKVFTPGYTTKKRGWGLGLSLAKRIVTEYHDGQIFVKNSELNKGTVFRILLKTSIL